MPLFPAPAGFWIRIGATLIDQMIVTLVVLLIAMSIFFLPKPVIEHFGKIPVNENKPSSSTPNAVNTLSSSTTTEHHQNRKLEIFV